LSDDDLMSRVATVATRLTTLDSQFGFSAWELQNSGTLGAVMDGIRGEDGKHRHIKEGYQYVGGFPAHLWKLATADDNYRLLSEGIKTFWKRWHKIRPHLNEHMNYVSIGPGTGEKDHAILKWLQEVSGEAKILYVPIDLSPDLLRTAVIESTKELERDRLVVMPIQLDITRDKAMRALKDLLDELNAGTPKLVSLLGNTLANFRDDAGALAPITKLIVPGRDKLLVELATATEATPELARQARAEYEGSGSFRRFVMATLSDFTNCRLDDPEMVKYDSTAVAGVIEVTANYVAPKAAKVIFRDDEHFAIRAKEKIELLITRKYTDAALAKLLRGFEEVESAPESYDDNKFGLVTKLLAAKAQRDTQPSPRPHPVGG
jgi:L-histidine N-alpha-methyltransferase